MLARNQEITESAWLYVIARVLNEAPEGKMFIGGRRRFVHFHGLDFESLKRTATTTFGFRPSDEALERALNNAAAHEGKRIPNQDIAKRLGTTLEEILLAKAGVGTGRVDQRQAHFAGSQRHHRNSARRAL